MKISRPLKQIFWMVGGVLTVLAASIVLLVAYFIFLLAGEPSKDEVVRNISPTGKMDAVLLETNGGATTSFGYEIYVVEHGAQPSGSPAVSLYDAVRNQHAYGANLKWISPDSVAVEFLSAKSAKIEKPVVSGAQTVHLVVHEGVLDNAAPPGGMLYNLRERQQEKKR